MKHIAVKGVVHLLVPDDFELTEDDNDPTQFRYKGRQFDIFMDLEELDGDIMSRPEDEEINSFHQAQTTNKPVVMIPRYYCFKDGHFILGENECRKFFTEDEKEELGEDYGNWMLDTNSLECQMLEI